jgi:hypothetical protein
MCLASARGWASRGIATGGAIAAVLRLGARAAALGRAATHFSPP